MLQALIFDIGNVLLNFDFEIAYRELEKHCDRFSEEAVLEVERLKVQVECGEIDRETFQIAGIAILGFRGDAATFSAIWQAIFRLNEPMVSFVQSLHGRYPLYLLSNTSAIHVEYIIQEYPIFNLFKDAVYSHEARLAKPDPAIFRYAAKRFGIDPAQAVYVDDLLTNVKSARDVGFRAMHYDARSHDLFLREMEPLLKS